MATQMLSKFEKYLSEFSIVLSLAIVLDPRNKLQLVNFCYTRLYGVKNSREYRHVHDKLISLFMEYGGFSTTSSSTMSLDTRRVDPQVPQPQVKRTSATMKVKLYVYFVIYMLLLVT
jgi:hypothetical protein